MDGSLDLVGLAASKPGSRGHNESHVTAIDCTDHSRPRLRPGSCGNSPSPAFGRLVRARRINHNDENMPKMRPVRSLFHEILPTLLGRPEPRLPQTRRDLWLRPSLTPRGSRLRDLGNSESALGVMTLSE